MYFILSLFYFGGNYTIVIEILILLAICSYGIKIKISHKISRVYVHRKPIQTIKAINISKSWKIYKTVNLHK